MYILPESHYFICHLKNSKLAWDICNVSVLGKANILLHSTTFSSERRVGEGRGITWAWHGFKMSRVNSMALFETRIVEPGCFGLSFPL